METTAHSNPLLLAEEEKKEKQRVLKRRTTRSSLETAISCEDIAAKIFGHLPLETLINCKSVSPLWNHMVCFIFSSHPSYGFITPCSTSCYISPNALDLLPVKFGFACTEAVIKLKNNLHSYEALYKWTLLDSCNGLLLFFNHYDRGYHVCNPITNDSTVLPQPHSDHYCSPPMIYNIGLAFDGHHYKVVYMRSLDYMFQQMFHAGGRVAKYQVFSSKTWSWVQLEKKFHNVYLFQYRCARESPEKDDSLCRPGVYFNGALWWTVKRTIYTLMYHVEKDFLRFHELPKYNFGIGNGKGMEVCIGGYLSESSGRMHYCYPSFSNKFYVWEYTNENNDEHDDDDDGFNIIKDCWLLKHVSNGDGVFGTHPLNTTFGSHSHTTHLRFCDDLKVVYFHIKLGTYFYSIETGECKKVDLESIQHVPISRPFEFFQYVFSLVDVPKRML